MQTVDFSSARVAILGIGREGQAAWRYLRKLHPGIALVLVSEAAADPGFLEQLSGRDRVLIGPLAEAGLERFDVLVRSPGISPYRESMQKARKAGAHITSASNLWFAAHPDQKTICITGTKGKSTTSALLAHMLEACGFRVRLAGNIGVPLLSCDDSAVDWWVIELSSYQLADLEARPGVSVILNLSSEHLDWHGSEDRYRKDKLRLAALAGAGPLIANAADPVLKAALSGFNVGAWFNAADGFRLEGDRLFDGERELKLKLPAGLPGRHNLSNAAAALTVLRCIGADLPTAMHSLASFQCLPHRLEFIGEKDGLRYVNDSISSTPLATAAALEAFSGQAVCLLVGGFDRGLDWGPYMASILKHLPLAIIGMPDSGARIIREMKRSGIDPENGLHESENLRKAVTLARELTPAGGIVLLSPGAPSFPQFRDFRDRGRRFRELYGQDAGQSAG